METVTLDTLRDDAAALAAEAKGMERRARWVKQQAAALRDRISQLQSKEDTSEQHTEHHE